MLVGVAKGFSGFISDTPSSASIGVFISFAMRIVPSVSVNNKVSLVALIKERSSSLLSLRASSAFFLLPALLINPCVMISSRN